MKDGSVMLRLATGFAVIAGVLAYLGLAVLGWGGFADFFGHPARTALAIVSVALAGAALFSSGNLSRGEREDRSNRWVIAMLGVIGLLDAYLPAYTDRKDVWTLDGDTVRWLGVALFAGGGALRLLPVFVLGHRFSGLVAIQPPSTGPIAPPMAPTADQVPTARPRASPEKLLPRIARLLGRRSAAPVP